MKKLFIILMLVFCIRGFSQTDTIYTKAAFNKAYLKSYLFDTRDVIVSPFKASLKQFFIFKGVVASDIIIGSQDAELRNFSLRNRNSTTRTIQQHFLEPFGSGVYSMPLLGAFYLYGSIKDDERSKQTALLGLKAFVVSGVIVTVPKQLFHRHRPCPCAYDGTVDAACANETPYEFDGPVNFGTNLKSFKDYVNVFFQSSDNSFPSGHSTSAFAVATVIAEQYKYKRWVPVVAYSLAGLTSLSRIEANKHWASDVFMGAVLGYSIGKFITRKKNWRTRPL
jgi:membrane-associated phospholipid phosphatase